MILRNYIQPDALDHMYQEETEFSPKKRADQTMERYLPEFDGLRRKEEARVIMGGAFPDASVSILRMQNAALSRNGKSLSLASVQRSLDFPTVAKQMRPLCEPRGGSARQAVLAATDSEMESEEEDLSYEARAA